MATIPSNKRQRIAEQSLNISNLPDGILANVASYLAQPSRALFAVAMTAPSKSWTKDNFSIGSERQQTIASILSSGLCEELDFGAIEKSLAVKLTDDDVHAVLKCINAQDVLKKLKLSGCISITGRGLQVLRESTVIEYIDLSLVKQFESPELDPEPMISEADVIPILDSIVSMNGNSLKMIVFPKKWRTAETTEFTQLLINYNQLLESREPKCSKCEGFVILVEHRYRSVFFGRQSYCCHNCYDHFCYDCDDNEQLHYCGICEKYYCVDCAPIRSCDKCSRSMCSGCSYVYTCDRCLTEVCSDCEQNPVVICHCNVGNDYCRSCNPETRPCTREECNKVHCVKCEPCSD